MTDTITTEPQTGSLFGDIERENARRSVERFLAGPPGQRRSVNSDSPRATREEMRELEVIDDREARRRSRPEVLAPLFDYGTLPADVADDLRSTAHRIRARIKSLTSEAIEAGRDLIAAKEKVGHGNFGTWLAAEFSMSETTARNYMRAAEVFGSKAATIAELPPTTVYQLASPTTPPEVREKIITRVEAGEKVPPGEIRDILEEHRDRARAARIERKLGKTQRKSREERQAQREAAHAKWAREDARRTAQAKVIAEMIAGKFGDELPELVALLGDYAVWSQAGQILRGDHPEL